MKIRFAVLVLVIFLIPSIPAGAEYSRVSDFLRIPAKNLDSYSFTSDSPLSDRIGLPPKVVLDYIRSLDNRPDYQAYHPTEYDRQLAAKYFELLPPLHRKVLRERLVGVYFIKDFLGSGLTEYVLDESGNMYAFMVFNPGVLKYGVSKWLTMKENTCFIPGSGSVDIRIDVGNGYKGLLYILLHETTHVVDYVMRVTPYVDESVARFFGHRPETGPFVRGVWESYKEPVDEDFPHGDRITFYGMNNGPKISLTQALTVYSKLENGPFVSMYSTLSWAEDLAEFVTFYHLTKK